MVEAIWLVHIKVVSKEVSTPMQILHYFRALVSERAVILFDSPGTIISNYLMKNFQIIADMTVIRRISTTVIALC